MTVSTTDIQNDIGELYSEVANGTTAVQSIIARATSFISLQSVSDDEIIRPLADAMVVNQMMGGLDGVNKTIGTLSVGNKDLRTMQKYFMDEAKKAAIMKGVSLDGFTIIFKDTEDA